ncbi:MAG: bifunctional UDP-3-O-[3-hydroxymyristoyl] N-acetylglucosamine deacetylase/3-hydroxyacyl-ACP dehydratase [Bacteroidales bacterium]|jgi:UDP-3-O-[3-hydroxymyristoyl] N-acetylglucosamine deacetylase/3-hydroxyacyl-[acyl-carrier-protein] dehydratase|nr:bifunctional UDP-3-O-[3-hydroxymyristoyl] N-acetylglucosamine deacetylase/3-hydroxyacyl-ACP dehydratase [Bacteroidales bacterium]MDD4702795.1 bifunctional UDP-3-O-[3-hydroxymyristoyl] N-acetylglucosamine deacetylase/3-hydroxyacyl-ACP dehydratase [Bacteroidales bacterium]
MEHQNTIKSKITVSGKGLHSGNNINVSLLPAEANTGIIFRRIDIESKPTIPALIDYVTDTSRGTTIEKDGIRVSTLEHLMASLHYFNIDNVIIELDSNEIPILDGSARIWVEKIKEVGVQQLIAKKYYYSIKNPISFKDEKNQIEITAMPYDGFKVDITIDYNSSVLGVQTMSIDSLDSFEKDIAPCRTFVFLHEIEQLFKLNLIKGGDLDNALIFVEHTLKQEQIDYLAKVFDKNPQHIKVEKGTLNNVEKRFDNEPARHKLLDFIGDIYLLGVNLKGHFILKRPGHYANTEFAKLIKQVIMEKMTGSPYYDPNKEPVFTINDIKNLLPHRFPMLLVDKIIEVGDDYVIGVKNVTGNEDFFNGHFPQEPIMPGVLIVEAMGQTGGILVLKDYPDPENYTTYFLRIDGVRFRGKVVPGDSLIFRLFLTEPVRRGIVKMKGEAYVGNKLVMEAELMAQVAKTK